jgi:hypothetical protein
LTADCGHPEGQVNRQHFRWLLDCRDVPNCSVWIADCAPFIANFDDLATDYRANDDLDDFIE